MFFGVVVFGGLISKVFVDQDKDTCIKRVQDHMNSLGSFDLEDDDAKVFNEEALVWSAYEEGDIK